MGTCLPYIKYTESVRSRKSFLSCTNALNTHTQIYTALPAFINSKYKKCSLSILHYFHLSAITQASRIAHKRAVQSFRFYA